MPTVIVASDNKVKRNAINDAFKEYFSERINIKMISVLSDVPRQPFGQETVMGAKRRMKKLKKCTKKFQIKYDFLVAVEAGVINLNGYWYNIQFVLIEDSKGKESSGISQGFCIPPQYISKVKATSINRVFVDLFGERKDWLEVITHEYSNRRKCIKDATVMALAGVVNGPEW